MYDGALQFAPTLPAAWTRYQFNLTVRGNRLNVTVERNQVIYRLLEGNGLSFKQGDTAIELSPQVSQFIVQN
jgi:alpha,alpha-trehalose phosphorylase